MFKKNDPYTVTRFCPLFQGATQIGNLSLEYQVTLYDDVQLAAVGAAADVPNRKFLLHCTQRINIWNPNAVDLSPGNFTTFYTNYPVMINASISIENTANSGMDFQLMDYSPQTVNTKVESAGTTGGSSGATTGSSTNSTVGSSTSQTNSYGASVSVGLGDVTSIGGSANYEYSSTDSQEQSFSRGTESSASRSREASNSASMSIKDWGAYAMINPKTKSPSWTFGQEYPWDVIDCKQAGAATNPNDNAQVQLTIPNEMSFRLYDGVSLYPPSQLSMFGVNFTMKALWLVTLNNGANVPDQITIDHTLNYFSASHALTTANPPTVAVYLDKQPSILSGGGGDSPPPTTTTEIDLALMALDPLGVQGKSAIIGFIPNKFVVSPAPTGSAPAVPFEIVSTSNNLIIKDTTPKYGTTAGAGFTASETELTAAFTKDTPALQLTVYFKVTDTVNDYTLYMKHWKSNTTGVILTFTINGDTSNQITKYVDALEAEGGDLNLLSIALRNQDYASIDYHDYLQLGLNHVQIGIAPIGGSVADCGYEIRAISIEKI